MPKKFGTPNALLTVPFTAKCLTNSQQGFASKRRGAQAPLQNKTG
jgi:hypothetical protein